MAGGIGKKIPKPAPGGRLGRINAWAETGGLRKRDSGRKKKFSFWVQGAYWHKREKTPIGGDGRLGTGRCQLRHRKKGFPGENWLRDRGGCRRKGSEVVMKLTRINQGKEMVEEKKRRGGVCFSKKGKSQDGAI